MNQEEKDDYIKSLVQEVARREADMEALRAEFAKPESRHLTTEELREKLSGLVADAVITLKDLMDNSEKESVRFAAAKFVLDIKLNDKPKDGEEDPVADLIRQLQSK